MKLLFLGGGVFQVPGILCAKRLGIESVVIDGNACAPGLALADYPFKENFTDAVVAEEIARKECVDGVITISTEVGVLPCAKVAEALSLPGIPVEVALAATDKVVMREKLQTAGIPVPAFRECVSLDDAKEATKATKYPAIIKPAVGSGSRGIQRVGDWKGLQRAFADTKGKSKDGRIIIESFMAGEEIHVDCLVHRGKITLLGIADKVRTPLPHRSDIRVTYPASLSASQSIAVEKLAKDSIEAIGIDSGTAHIEMLVEGDNARIVEVAARGAGFNVFGLILKEISGIDPVEACVKMALGQEPSLERTREGAAILSFFRPKPGKLKRVSGISEAMANLAVLELTITAKAGDTINHYRCGDDRVGHVIISADSVENAENVLSKVEETVRFEVQQ